MSLTSLPAAPPLPLGHPRNARSRRRRGTALVDACILQGSAQPVGAEPARPRRRRATATATVTATPASGAGLRDQTSNVARPQRPRPRRLRVRRSAARPARVEGLRRRRHARRHARKARPRRTASAPPRRPFPTTDGRGFHPRARSTSAPRTPRPTRDDPKACCYTSVIPYPAVAAPSATRPARRRSRAPSSAPTRPRPLVCLRASRASTPEARAVLAEHWTQEAAFEHASIASFARLTLDLLSVGAPPDLLDAARATLDEIEHARITFALATATAGSPGRPCRAARSRRLAHARSDRAYDLLHRRVRRASRWRRPRSRRADARDRPRAPRRPREDGRGRGAARRARLAHRRLDPAQRRPRVAQALAAARPGHHRARDPHARRRRRRSRRQAARDRPPRGNPAVTVALLGARAAAANHLTTGRQTVSMATLLGSH